MGHEMNTKEYHTDQKKKCDCCGNLFYRHRKYGPKYWSKAMFCSVECRTKHARNKTPSMSEVFSKNIDTTGDCWIWTWIKDKDGYGLMPYKGKMHRAHVLSLKLAGRPTNKDNPLACHTCDNPSCVNPLHLYAGDKKTNAIDMVQRGRSLTGEKNSQSKLTNQQVSEIRSSQEKVTALARKFKVSHAAISMIKHNKTWKNSNGDIK